ncbi:hypothetical protein C1I97_36330, partial [Streptomyces sp. NTH33]
MGQPEMQPERPPQDGRDDGAAGLRPGDLTGRPFPLGDWGEPAQRLDELYRWVERGGFGGRRHSCAVPVGFRRERQDVDHAPGGHEAAGEVVRA